MNIRKFFTKKAVIVSVIILGLGGFAAAKIFGGSAGNDILTDVVRRQDIKRTILATGQVTSTTDLSLSFKTSGAVKSVSVAVGAVVRPGQVLAQLDQKDELASLTTARGALAQAEANYQKILDGASSEEISVARAAVQTAQVALQNSQNNLSQTKAEQTVLAANAYRTMLNAGLVAQPVPGNLNSSNPAISGTYIGTETGTYTITTRGNYFDVTGLEDSGSIGVSTTAPKPLGTRGLFVQFPANYVAQNDSWTVDIPNTKSSSYVTNYNAYQAALQTSAAAIESAEGAVASAESTLGQRQADLNYKLAKARPADLAVAQAQIISAQGQVETAVAALENTIIRAPVAGTITSVVVKTGELASALQEAIVVQDVKDLYLEANISEANIAGIKLGQKVDVTFDALGADKRYEAAVQFVEPASTLVSGIVNFKIKASISREPEILPGMTADLKILVEQKPAALTVPQRAILSRDQKKFVRVVTDEKTRSYEEREVAVGLYADEGLAEIVSGLAEGQTIVTFISKK